MSQDAKSVADDQSAAPWSQPPQAVADRLDVDLESGLPAQQVEQRRRRYGPNSLREARREAAWRILARQFGSLIVLLLVGAAIVSLLFGQLREAVAIAAVVVINAAIGFATELKAVRSMEALRQLGRVRARTRRDGSVCEVAASEIVPGDVVLLEAGAVVPADLRLCETSKLQADESPLTGESAPVAKTAEQIDADTDLAERSCMAFRGTSITRGSGEGIAVATGMRTQIGQIAELVEEAEADQTPLEKRLDQLGTRLVWVTLGVAAAVTVSGYLSGKDLLLMVETGIALAVATVPEGLPIVATIALARGMWRMARRNALINRLSAVETLGATTIICSDKTGTLTENRMTVTRVILDGGAVEVAGEEGNGFFRREDAGIEASEDGPLKSALEIGVLCNNAELGDDDDEGSGEPMEIALLAAGRKAGIHRAEILKRLPESREEAFTPESKRMATLHEDEGSVRVAVKGAPEAVLEASTRILTADTERDLDEDTRARWQELNEEAAGEGLRVLALAQKEVDDAGADPYEDLVFVGLVGFLDPPRAEVKEAIDRCNAAGIRAIMVTGDQRGTAAKVGEALGMLGEDEEADVLTGDQIAAPDSLGPDERRRLTQAGIFARVSPKQKLDLIALHQEEGAIVAMTGDGVNDAPALKKADIGVAMGKRGTQVAAQAADMVLQDDSFSTIVAAVEHGRVIFDNIRNFVYYLLSCNLSEVLIVATASIVRLPLPIEPLQILFLNLVTDVFPALALGVGEGDPGIMRRRPRDPKEPILTRTLWLGIGSYGLLITASVLAAFVLMLQTGSSSKEAVTISFLTLATAQLWHVFNMRATDSGPIANDIVRNPWIWAALALCIGLLGLAVFFAPLAEVLNVALPDRRGWVVIASFSLLPLVVGQLVIVLKAWRKA